MLIKSATSVKQIIGVILNALNQKDEGRLSLVTTSKGDQVNTAFKVVEAKDLIVSNQLDGRINPDYPQELQPRDRTRLSSRRQVSSIASNLNPALLTDSGLSSHGSPIIGDDYVVESGNGRVMGILTAYKSGQGDKYKQFITDSAPLFGLKKSDVGKMDQPILVRVRKDKIDRLQFVKDSNISDLQSMSASEQASVDAERFNESMLSLFNPSDDGDLFAKSNMPFIHEYIKNIGDTESAGLLTATGEPTRQLIDRLQNAIFSRAYNDKNLVKMVSEEADPEIRNVLKALNVSAGDFMMMKHLSKETHESVAGGITGGIDGYSKTIGDEALEALTEAINVFKDAKRSGQSINEYLSQLGLFGDISEKAKSFALFIASNNRSAKKMGVAFKSLANQINYELTHNALAVGDLFGDEPASLTDILKKVSIENETPEFDEKLSILESLPVLSDDDALAFKFKGNKEVSKVSFYNGRIEVRLKQGYSFDEPSTYDNYELSTRVATVDSYDDYKKLKTYIISDINNHIDDILNHYQRFNKRGMD